MYKILLVENDKDILEVNKKTLEAVDGYAVQTAMDLEAARKQINNEPPDIIVLDIMLPDGNGLNFLKELRVKNETNPQLFYIPVLLLTALDESADIVRGLQAGGDDYLAKPYDNDVLLARIESLLRRAARVPNTLVIGPLTMDIIAGRVFFDSPDSAANPVANLPQDLLLTSKEFAILLLLAQNRELILSPESIYQNVWKQPLADSTNTLHATISTLRKKIEPSGYTIKVKRDQGYKFEKGEKPR